MNDRQQNIILEKKFGRYSPGLLKSKWTAESFTKAAIDIVQGIKIKDVVDKLNGQLVPKKWFDWKKVFSGGIKEENVEVSAPGTPNSRIIVTFPFTLEGEDFQNFIFGDEENEKFGGIFYNNKFRRKLKKAGINLVAPLETSSEESSNDDEEEEEEEEEVATESYNSYLTQNKLLNVYNSIVLEQGAVDSIDMFLVFDMKVTMKPKRQKLANEAAGDDKGGSGEGDEPVDDLERK